MPGPRPDRTPWIAVLLIVLFFGLSMVRQSAEWVLEYEWWKEMRQFETLVSMILYGVVPSMVAVLLAFVVLWLTHARAMKAAGFGLSKFPGYAKLATLILLVVAYVAGSGAVDNWTAVLYFGGKQVAPGAWKDPVFGHGLSFYFFALPFYQMLLRVVLVISFLTCVVYLGTRVYWLVRESRPRLTEDGNIELPEMRLDHLKEFFHDSLFLRLALILFLLTLAASRYMERYEFLTKDHAFMVGIDYVDENIRLPLRWVSIVGVLMGAGLVMLRRWMLILGAVILPMIVESVAPQVVHSLYVRPNEISLQKPYIERHIQATRTAYGLDRRSREMEYKASLEMRIDTAKHKPLLDNIRLWDWRAFHDTVTQIQALRPYYVFQDTDVDRYKIDGELRQVMLTPREIDVRQLSGDARSRWMNPHFIYTHGYGMVLAEANRITRDGLPMLFIQNAPPEIKTPSLKLTRPELYYGESTHEPVFVRTAQAEFNYPSGAENVHSRYDGKGGFPISGLGMRLAAALAYTDWNIVLTGFLTPESRMMIRRNVRERVSELAGFLTWDTDPYLVLTPDGRMVWMIDAYTTSDAHPYAARVRLPNTGRANYMRNAVKATVDAYDGTVHLYVFDEADPIIQAYAKLFPGLLESASAMPADLREHARYPETLFRVQAEMYRTFHMRDAEAFYNKEDAWDIARYLGSNEGKPEYSSPTYVVATLPGETKPEFLLMIPFTPRNKDNLIGFMAARCDGEKLGELLFLQLSKQELVFGPLQIEARINQDQNISKDLSLWNQQGSRVLRGQMLVLPVDNTFVYIEPVYIQASEARMPQLKKVVIATGNSLIYSDTYEQAVAELATMSPQAPVPKEPAPSTYAGAPPTPAVGDPELGRKLDQVRRHLQRYRELSGQGKFVEAAKELEALEAAAKR
ncbi:MAG: UPF0182 family protein [Acidobacteria bacterium]|nr:UPF0182 family protein [Acidobacteriota bacterium]